jgi:hypothetical protein
MDADLEHQIVLTLPLHIQPTHGFAHAQRCSNGAVGRRKCRHHRIADRLHHGTRLGADDLGHHPEMRAYQVIGNQVAHLLVEFGRALQVREQEGEAGDLEPLFDVKCVGVIDVTEGLIAEQPLRSDERLSPGKQLVQFRASDPNAGQRAGTLAVLDVDPERPRAERRHRGRCGASVQQHRDILPLPCGIALDLDELRAVGHRIEHNRQPQR